MPGCVCELFSKCLWDECVSRGVQSRLLGCPVRPWALSSIEWQWPELKTRDVVLMPVIPLPSTCLHPVTWQQFFFESSLMGSPRHLSAIALV